MAAEIIKIGGVQIHYSLSPSETGNSLTLFRCVLEAGAKVPVPHYHEGFDETIYGLTGTVTYTVDGKTMQLRAGDALFIPRGTVHHFANDAAGSAEFLCFCGPGGMAPDYFHDIASVLSHEGPVDVARMKEVMLAHGIVPVNG